MKPKPFAYQFYDIWFGGTITLPTLNDIFRCIESQSSDSEEVLRQDITALYPPDKKSLSGYIAIVKLRDRKKAYKEYLKGFKRKTINGQIP